MGKLTRFQRHYCRNWSAFTVVGWHAGKTVIAEDNRLHDLHQSLHECLYLPGLVTTVGVVWGAGTGGAGYACTAVQRRAFVEAGVTALGRASVSDNIAGAVAALLGSKQDKRQAH